MAARGAVRLLLLSLLLLALVRSSAPAQERSRAAERVKHLNELLALTDVQSRQILEILTRQDAAAARDNTAAKGNRRAQAKALKARVTAGDREIEALLTPEQLKKYASYKKARRSELDTRKRPRGTEYE